MKERRRVLVPMVLVLALIAISFGCAGMQTKGAIVDAQNAWMTSHAAYEGYLVSVRSLHDTKVLDDSKYNKAVQAEATAYTALIETRKAIVVWQASLEQRAKPGDALYVEPETARADYDKALAILNEEMAKLAGYVITGHSENAPQTQPQSTGGAK